MQKQSGNFLLQALLALTLVFAFLPFLAGKLSSRDMTTKLLSVKETIDVVQTAARIYLRENKNNLNIGSQTLSGVPLTQKLEPYGLPMGFSRKTIFNQEFSLQYNKADANEINAHVILSPGNITKMQAAELVRMIGPMAIKNDDQSINIAIPVTAFEYSNVVYRNMMKYNDVSFSADLVMGENNIEHVGTIDNMDCEYEAGHPCYVLTSSAKFSSPAGGKLHLVEVSSNNFNFTIDQSQLSPVSVLFHGGLNVKDPSQIEVTNLSDVESFDKIGIVNVAETAVFPNLTSETGTVKAKSWAVDDYVIASAVPFVSNALLALNGIRIYTYKKDENDEPIHFDFSVDKMDITKGSAVYVCQTGSTLSGSNVNSECYRDDTNLYKGVAITNPAADTRRVPDIYISADSFKNSEGNDLDVIRAYTADFLSQWQDPNNAPNHLFKAGQIAREPCESVLNVILAGLNGRYAYNPYAYNPNSLRDRILCKYLFLERLELRYLFKTVH